jgi:hypothetical protein
MKGQVVSQATAQILPMRDTTKSGRFNLVAQTPFGAPSGPAISDQKLTFNVRA